MIFESKIYIFILVDDSTYAFRLVFVNYTQQTKARSAYKHIAIVACIDILDIGGNLFSVYQHRYFSKLITVVDEQIVVGSKVDVTFMILSHAVHVVVDVVSVLVGTIHHGEVVAVVAVESVSCSNPNKTAFIL